MPSYYMTMRHGHRISALLNNMILFKKQELARSKGKPRVKPEWFLNPSKSWKLYTSIIKFMCCLMGLANNWCFFFHMNALIHPCFSINLFYHLSSECVENGLGFSRSKIPPPIGKELAIRIWIVITGLAMWLSISSAALCVIAMLTIKGHCITCYIQYYQRF